MNRYVIPVMVFLLLGVQSCKNKVEKGNLDVQLKGYVGERELSFVNTIYNDSMGKEFFFSTLQFYLSHFRLIKTDNSSIELADVAFLDYDDKNWKSFSVAAPEGDYKGIAFYVGLDAAQNDTKPEDFPSSHPLGPQKNMYWSWLKHRFVNLEGRADTSGQNFTDGSIGLTYHVGRDTCYREVMLTGPSFSIMDGVNKKIQLNVDILKVFYGTTDTIDMFLEPGTQSEDFEIDLAIKFAEQFSKAFSYSE